MIGKKEAAKIIRESDLPEGPRSSQWKFAAAPKETRRTLISRKPDSEEGRICAAIEIQRVYRGYCTRCRLMNVVKPDISKTAVYDASQHELSRLGDARTPSPQKSTTLSKPTTKVTTTKTNKQPSKKPGSRGGRERLLQYYDSYVNRMITAGTRPEEVASFEDFCANYIQNWWAKMKREGKVKSSTGNYSKGSASTRTSTVKKKREAPLNQHQAATIIQKAWRQHIDVQVYRYYRDLINFKNRGDPSMMLRCINPNEARLLDPAAGVHIKFRLAGDRFPPNIYYKIYTHRPIQDLCANAPRDYTRFDAKRQMARDVHNKGNRVPSQDKTTWYQRIENNGWRLVSDRLIHHMLSDPVTWETSRKKVEFHHNKTKRRQDVEKRKKQKKIEWMQKMYKDGMLRAKATDKETVELIEGAAAGMVATIDAHGPSSIQDWEVDELLDWTTSLNFDDYMKTWQEAATSAASERPVFERLKLYTDDSDPYELSITGDSPSRHNNSTRPSHNTPVSGLSVTSY